MYVVSPIAVFVARAIVGSKPDPSSTQDRWRPTKALKNPIAVDFRDRVSEVGNLEVGRRESKCDGRSRQRELDGGVDQIANGLSECSLRGLDANLHRGYSVRKHAIRLRAELIDRLCHGGPNVERSGDLIGSFAEDEIDEFGNEVGEPLGFR